MVRVGLVTEGSHDFMLEPLVRAELESRGCNEVEFDRLQPQQDATGYYPDGGWTRVLAWCLANGADDLDDVFLATLENVPGIDLLVIHLDGDVADHISTRTTQTLPTSMTISNRVKYITSAIEDWLKVDSEQRKRIIIAVPVMHTECWVNAADASFGGPFEVATGKVHFRSGWDRTRLPKLADYYSGASEAAASGSNRIAQRCVSYRAFRKEVETREVE